MANPPFDLTLTSPTWDTATPKFGSGALTGGRAISAAPVFVAGMTAWTLECWIKTTDNTGATQIICGQTSAAFIAKYADHCFAGWGTSGVNIATGTLNDGNWHHIALCVGPAGGTLFLDGVNVANSTQSYAASGPAYTTTFGIMSYGSDQSAAEFLGEVDDLRISSVIRYAANFTPSATAFDGTLANTRALYTLDSVGTDSSTTGSDMTPTVPTTTIPVNSPALVFSPGNWWGDTGRGGSVSRTSWNQGAWVRIAWVASASPVATLLLTSTARTNMVSYFINDVLVDNVATTTSVAISNVIPSVRNTLTVYLRNSATATRWATGALNQLTVTGFQVDTGSTADVATPLRPWGLMVGDSITEGAYANDNNDDWMMDYSFLMMGAADQLGYDIGVSACSFSGWLTAGDDTGDVPAYYDTPGGTYSDSASRWNKISQGVSLLDSNSHISAYGAIGTEPAWIYINYATNEYLNSASVSDMQASITQAITALRAAAPSAKIFIQIPFGLQYLAKYPNTAYVSAIRAAVAAHSADANVILSDFGVSFANKIEGPGYASNDDVHPIQTGHALVAPLVSQKIALAFSSGGSNRWAHS